MRLNQKEINAIKTTANEIFKNPQIFLFGSRTNDNIKGGDIDLYIKLSYKPHFLDKPKFLAKLKRIIGDQKIDLVINYPGKEAEIIDTIVQKEGIKL